MPLYFKYFFTEGFKDIEPNSYNINIKDNSKITLTYNESITDLEIIYDIIKFVNGKFVVQTYRDLTISKGNIELNLNSLDKNTIYLSINIKYNPIVIFKLNFSGM